MKKFAALVIGVGGIALGIYLAVWVMFVGGVNQIVDAVSRHPASGTDIGWGIVKILLSEVPLILSWASIIIAGVLWEDATFERRRQARRSEARQRLDAAQRRYPTGRGSG